MSLKIYEIFFEVQNTRKKMICTKHTIASMTADALNRKMKPIKKITKRCIVALLIVKHQSKDSQFLREVSRKSTEVFLFCSI